MNTQPFTEEQIESFQIIDTALLVAAINGKIDLNEMAQRELQNRGLNNDGKWVGFKNCGPRL